MQKIKWKIKGKYMSCPWEVIDSFDTKDEAETMLVEYRIAYGRDWVFEIVKGVK